MKRVVGVVTIILTIGSITAGCGGDDQANAIDETVQSFAAALTNGDVQAIAAAYTDKGLAEDQHVGSREEFLASNPDDVKQAIELTDVVARVEGDAATVDVSGVAEDSYIFKYRYPMVDIDGEWKFDGAGVPLEVPIPDGAKAIDLQLSHFAFAWQPTQVTSGEVAFRIENVGQQPHEAVLVKVAEGVNLQDALFSEGPPAGIEFLGFQ